MIKPFSKNSFTLLELIIAIAILAILAVLATPSFRIFQKNFSLDSNAQEIANILRYAQNKTTASEGESQYGVYFNGSATPNEYVLFKGESYTARDQSFDQIHKFPDYIEIYNLNLGAGNEVVFNRIDGSVSSPGDLSIRLTNDYSKTKTIYIESSGLVSFDAPSVPSDGRLIDSRHVHLDLGWSIQNASKLKFYFPFVPQTETIDMASYFNDDKTVFDWSGTFNVSGVEQSLRVHTHYLDANNTILCVHRGHNDGKNNQELTIYIVDGGVDKDIAHYLTDATSTVEKGSYCNNDLQVQ